MVLPEAFAMTLCSSVFCVLTKLILRDGPCDKIPHVSICKPYNQASGMIAIEHIISPCVYHSLEIFRG